MHKQQEGRKQWLNDYSSVTTMLQWWLLKKIKSPLWIPIVTGLCCLSVWLCDVFVWCWGLTWNHWAFSVCLWEVGGCQLCSSLQSEKASEITCGLGVCDFPPPPRPWCWLELLCWGASVCPEWFEFSKILITDWVESLCPGIFSLNKVWHKYCNSPKFQFSVIMQSAIYLKKNLKAVIKSISLLFFWGSFFT